MRLITLSVAVRLLRLLTLYQEEQPAGSSPEEEVGEVSSATGGSEPPSALEGDFRSPPPMLGPSARRFPPNMPMPPSPAPGSGRQSPRGDASGSTGRDRGASNACVASFQKKEKKKKISCGTITGEQKPVNQPSFAVLAPFYRSAVAAKAGIKKYCILTPEDRARLLEAVTASVRQLKDFFTVDCARNEASASSFLDLFEGIGDGERRAVFGSRVQLLCTFNTLATFFFV